MGDHLGGGRGISVTAREIGTYSSATEAFSSLGGYITTGYELSGGAQPERVNAARLTANMFLTLRVQPILGRVFTAQEEDTYQPLAVISYGLWLNRYHRDPRVLDGSIILDRKTYSIIGVMPRSFELFICVTLTCSARFPFINSVLPTKHLFDHDSTMMSYSNSLRFREAGSLINRPVTFRTMASFWHPRTGTTVFLTPLSTTTELVVINLVPQHNPQPDPQFASCGGPSFSQSFLDQFAAVETL